MCVCVCVCVCAAVAWWMIPQQWVLNLGFVTFNSWRIFVFFLFLPSFVSCIGFSYLDESPKFLMSCGRQEEALKIFRKMYSMNTGNPKEMYPVIIIIIIIIIICFINRICT